MYKLLIFDLDGVLADTSGMHESSIISAIEEHVPDIVFDENALQIIQMAVPTMVKLQKLGIDPELAAKIANTKQDITASLLNKIPADKKLVKIFRKIYDKYSVAVASNSHTKTVEKVLDQLGILEFVDFYIGNDLLQSPKPSPEIFNKCFSHFNVSSAESIIFEDSPVGLMAARLSGSKVIPVKSPKDFKRKVRRYLVY